MDRLARVADLSLRARALQLFVRESAPVDPAACSVRVGRERATLQQLYGTMQAAAPELKICRPEQASCDCAPDATLMQSAARAVVVVGQSLADLDAALATGPAGLAALSDGALSYPGGRVEAALETMCEAVDLYVDLAAGRPLMTARIAPITPSSPPAARVPVRPAAGLPLLVR